jgi:hypothetical protein
MTNPFAMFSFTEEADATSNDVKSFEVKNISDGQNLSPKKIYQMKRKFASTKSDNNSTEGSPVNGKKITRITNKSNEEIMRSWWIELRNLTNNYPFAVILTGVVGSQVRDIVTVSALRNIATITNNDITPESVHSLSDEQLQDAIKSVNYCNVKFKTIRKLSAILCFQSVPDDAKGLMELPG